VADTIQEEESDFVADDHGAPGAEAQAQEVPLLDVLQEQLKFQAQHRPYVTVAAAVAVGYVLGGGIPWWAIRAATSIGSRILVARVVAAVVDEQ
jgi:hypothetical protein